MLRKLPLTPAADIWAMGAVFFFVLTGRGLHSSTFRLNVSAFCGIGGAIRGYRGIVRGALGVMMGFSGGIWCQKQLRLS
jgi:hypothetical protein